MFRGSCELSTRRCMHWWLRRGLLPGGPFVPLRPAPEELLLGELKPRFSWSATVEGKEDRSWIFSWNLWMFGRRAPEEPGKGVVFVTPLQGDREIRAAADVGFNVTRRLHSVRITGRDQPGIAAELTQKLADGRINLRGFSASVIGTQFVAYVAVDTASDANK